MQTGFDSKTLPKRWQKKFGKMVGSPMPSWTRVEISFKESGTEHISSVKGLIWNGEDFLGNNTTTYYGRITNIKIYGVGEIGGWE